MPVRPIDLQVIVPKSQNNPLNREHVVNREANLLHQTQQANKQESIAKDQHVNKLEQKSKGRVEEKKKDEKKDDKKKNDDKRQASSEKDRKKTTSTVKENNRDVSSEKTKTLKKSKPVGLNFHRFDMKV